MTHDPAFDNFDLGMVCGRCNRKTGNLTQGHYWSWCTVVRKYIGHHFCCPEDCELEGATPIRRVLTVRPGHIASECPDLIDCAAHTDWHLAWRERQAP